jgi:hypothetical protein
VKAGRAGSPPTVSAPLSAAAAAAVRPSVSLGSAAAIDLNDSARRRTAGWAPALQPLRALKVPRRAPVRRSTCSSGTSPRLFVSACEGRRSPRGGQSLNGIGRFDKGSSEMAAKAQPSPAVLQSKALREIATIHVLAKMRELAVEIDPHFAADVAPPPAEGEIFGKIASRIRVDHAIEKQPMQMRFRMAWRAVGRVVEVGIAFHQAAKYVSPWRRWPRCRSPSRCLPCRDDA